MADLRQCSKCGAQMLEARHRSLQPYNSAYGYKCRQCGYEVDLVPMGSIGSQLAMSLFLVAIIALFVFVYNDYPGPLTYLGVIIVGLVLTAPSLFDLWHHWRNPALAGEQTPEPELEHGNGVNRKAIEQLESGGFWGGFARPVLAFVIVITLAALFGFFRDILFS